MVFSLRILADMLNHHVSSLRIMLVNMGRVFGVVSLAKKQREARAQHRAAALAAANKRVQNLLKKADAELGAVNESLLQQDEEKALYAAAQGLQPKISAAVAEGNFQTALSELASVKPQVDAFFDGVMVMAEDAAVKQNRLNLLNRLAEQMNAVADIALLSE